ncbi:DUF3306 domain-containing protein [Marinobacter sp. VGCF2001]|uniref:DUF3306 domain-containing protein n=1 Tax=Marinobacter sp. VGCF2001 TaxID=3417189 RepID=UPI003CE82E2A
MAESRLQRWSRLKTHADRRKEAAPAPALEADASPEEQELARNETLSEQEVLEKYGLPDPETIELGTDVTGFMRKEIPDLLRRKALRSLWRSNPVLAVLDGLNDYDEDFTAAGPTIKGAKTLYKVGQGLIDKTAKVDEPPGDRIDGPTEQPALTPTESESNLEEPEPEGKAELPPEASGSELEANESGPEPGRHYRPRMRFQ